MRLKYQGVDEEEIAKELRFRYKKEYGRMEALILNKLPINNWYNIFRKAFNLQLLNRKDFLSLDLKEEASDFSEKIADALLSEELSNNSSGRRSFYLKKELQINYNMY